MGNYTYVAVASDLSPGTMKAVRAAGKSILLVNVDGDIYALSNFCTHKKCYLHDGKLEGEILTCPCHFAKFDVTTGAALTAPAKQPLAVYQVKLEGDDILVAI